MDTKKKTAPRARASETPQFKQLPFISDELKAINCIIMMIKLNLKSGKRNGFIGQRSMKGNTHFQQTTKKDEDNFNTLNGLFNFIQVYNFIYVRWLSEYRYCWLNRSYLYIGIIYLVYLIDIIYYFLSIRYRQSIQNVLYTT